MPADAFDRKNALTTASLAEGTLLPAFELPATGSGSVRLDDFTQRNLVIFFYPKADTQACTMEALDFTRLAPAFEAAGTSLLGVSADPPARLRRFADRKAIAVPLAADETHGLLEALGIWIPKQMFGHRFMGIERTTVLAGPGGRIVRVWRKVSVPGHAEEVLAAARALAAG